MRDDTGLQSLGSWHRHSDEAIYGNSEPKWPQVSRVPRWHFQSGDVVVESRTPLEITIKREDDAVHAENQRLHIFGSGESVDEAVDDFNHQLVHFFRYYTRLATEDVVGLAADVREIYLAEFEEKVVEVA